MGLGVKARGESFRIHLNFQGNAPSDTPQLVIEGQLYVLDLASDGAGTGISSATGGFEAGMVNSYLYIDFSGVGFTKGLYLISAVADTNNLTISSSAGANATIGAGRINNQTVVAASDMIQGVDTRHWHYDYVVAADAKIGAYNVIRSATVEGETLSATESYKVTTTAGITDGDSDANYD